MVGISEFQRIPSKAKMQHLGHTQSQNLRAGDGRGLCISNLNMNQYNLASRPKMIDLVGSGELCSSWGWSAVWFFLCWKDMATKSTPIPVYPWLLIVSKFTTPYCFTVTLPPVMASDSFHFFSINLSCSCDPFWHLAICWGQVLPRAASEQRVYISDLCRSILRRKQWG